MKLGANNRAKKITLKNGSSAATRCIVTSAAENQRHAPAAQLRLDETAYDNQRAHYVYTYCIYSHWAEALHSHPFLSSAQLGPPKDNEAPWLAKQARRKKLAGRVLSHRPTRRCHKSHYLRPTFRLAFLRTRPVGGPKEEEIDLLPSTITSGLQSQPPEDNTVFVLFFFFLEPSLGTRVFMLAVRVSKTGDGP